jgi:biphenyl-2,3-diol 1,2-dioxygenase
VAAFGWEVDDDAALDALTERLRTGGVDVHAGTDEEARRRGVTRLMKLNDPTGHPLEIFHGAERAKTPFVSRHVVSSFVTGSQGLGHVVVSAAEPERSMAFYRDLLGFRLSDRIACDIHGYAVDITFFHGGPRHHSVAIGGPQRKRVHHFMLEVASMDDVGLAFDRALRGGVRITQTLGASPQRPHVLVLREDALRLPFRVRLGRPHRGRRDLEADDVRPHQRVGPSGTRDARAKTANDDDDGENE